MSSYQWQSGTAGVWTNISGATLQTYLETNNEIGKYVRVAETVSGLTAYSNQLGLVTSGATAYFTENLNGAFSLTNRGDGVVFWINGYSGATTWTADQFAWLVDGPNSMGALRLTATNSGQGTYVSIDANCYQNRPHHGFIVGSNDGTVNGSGGSTALGWGHGFNDDCWYSFWIRIPSTGNTTLGQHWRNGLTSSFEFHLDATTEGDIVAYNPAFNVQSNVLGIQNDGATNATTPTNPRFRLQLTGGYFSQDTSGTLRTLVDSPTISLDTWYHVVTHWRLGETTAKALTEWWIDGVKVYPGGTGTVLAVGQQNTTGTQPTQYYEDLPTMRNPGHLSYGTGIEFLVYRSADIVDSFSTDFAQAVWGPTAASVGGTG